MTDMTNVGGVDKEIVEVLNLPQLRPNRMLISAQLIFSHEDLISRKQKKRLLQTGTDLFNQHPGKGVAYLHEHELLLRATPLQYPGEVVDWMRDNPHLDKRKIAEYIVNRWSMWFIGFTFIVYLETWEIVVLYYSVCSLSQILPLYWDFLNLGILFARKISIWQLFPFHVFPSILGYSVICQICSYFTFFKRLRWLFYRDRIFTWDV